MELEAPFTRIIQLRLLPPFVQRLFLWPGLHNGMGARRKRISVMNLQPECYIVTEPLSHRQEAAARTNNAGHDAQIGRKAQGERDVIMTLTSSLIRHLERLGIWSGSGPSRKIRWTVQQASIHIRTSSRNYSITPFK